MSASPESGIPGLRHRLERRSRHLGGCARLAGDLTLVRHDESRTAERIRDAEIVLLNKVELTRAHAAAARRVSS